MLGKLRFSKYVTESITTDCMMFWSHRPLSIAYKTKDTAPVDLALTVAQLRPGKWHPWWVNMSKCEGGNGAPEVLSLPCSWDFKACCIRSLWHCHGVLCLSDSGKPGDGGCGEEGWQWQKYNPAFGKIHQWHLHITPGRQCTSSWTTWITHKA